MSARRTASSTARRWAWLAPLSLALLAMSCASADKLARQSDELLARGDMRGAYEKARRALDKDAGNASARTAYAAAAGELGDDFEGRMLRLAAADTVAAARVALDYRDLRAEIARYPVEVTPEPSYRAQEDRILEGAARALYRAGDEAMTARHPKEAWRHFSEAMGFDPAYLDVTDRVADAYARGLTQVAVLPFEDQVGLPGLAASLQRSTAAELAHRAASPAFRFTRVMGLDRIEQGMTVSESRGLTREQARSLGRRLGADRVVCGRITALRTDSDLADWRSPIYHAEKGTDAAGQESVRWVQEMLHVVSRTRHVRISVTYEVVDVRGGAVLAQETQPYEMWARVVWSDFVPAVGAERYQLAPGDAPASETDRASRDWSERMHGMALPELLQKIAGKDRREHWNGRYRGEFPPDTRDHPVVLGELPPEAEMAELALRTAWQPVLEALRVLDPQD